MSEADLKHAKTKFKSQETNRPLPSRKVADQARTRTKKAKAALACNHCKSRKVKCVLDVAGCKRCSRLGIPCSGPSGDQRKFPSSKSHIKELYDRIAYLESALEAATNGRRNPSSMISPRANGITPRTNSTRSTSPPIVPPGDNDSIISRLCGRQWKLNSDEDGQYKFFGPTSSLHLTENISSSLIDPSTRVTVADDATIDGIIDLETQTHLLDVYWTYQHTVLQVFDREEFLDGMKTRQSRYFSTPLLCAVYACAARISDRPHIRSMVVPSHDALEDEQPQLVAIATKLVNRELQKPQITTIQALLLLSVIHCSSSQDTKGWLLVGIACRLAVDFGLHSFSEQIASVKLTERDIKVRKITYFGCLVFDRLWALYLGRPFCLQIEDAYLEDHFMPQIEESWEMRIAFAWARLLVIIGQICEALNGENCSADRLEELDAHLQYWHQSLNEDLTYSENSYASVLLLHMQYFSAKIILHRPAAAFGSLLSQTNMPTNYSQQLCVDNAINIATALLQYRQCFHDATTMSGVGLHIIATASTILIATIADKRSIGVSDQIAALKTCVFSLGEMERTYPVARRVRRIIRLVMSLCHVEIENIDTRQENENHNNQQPQPIFSTTQVDPEASNLTGNFTFEDGDMTSMSWYDFFYANEVLPAGSSQFDIMYGLDY